MTGHKETEYIFVPSRSSGKRMSWETGQRIAADVYVCPLKQLHSVDEKINPGDISIEPESGREVISTVLGLEEKGIVFWGQEKSGEDGAEPLFEVPFEHIMLTGLEISMENPDKKHGRVWPSRAEKRRLR